MAENELVPFVLEDVEGLDAGDKKGSGAYGAVYRVTVKGVTCIAKRLHDILINPEVSADEKASVRRKFSAECILLSQLRHPHVVHFVGVHYGKRSDDLSLIMECLHMDLAKFSDSCTTEKLNIPMSIKLSILLDVSYGLLYFHTHSPPIIHRDLSANNILLTTDLRAKIADLGVAKLLESQTQVAIAQTKAPGTLYYMPPEALQENPVYDLKLDIFSFGHLMLYAAAQKFPDVHELDDATMYVALQENTVQIRKRRKVIEQIGGKQHCLHSILTQCLQDKLERRPTAYKLNERLKELCTENPRSVAEVLKLITDVDKTPSQDEVQLNGQNWLELKRELATVQEENRKLTVDIGTLHRDKQLLEEASKTAQARIKELDVLVEKLQTLRRLKESQLKDTEYKPTPELLQGSQLQEGVSTDSELERKLSEQRQVIQRLQQESEELQSSLQIVKIEAELFKEDFESERRDREAAHGKIADLMTKHDEETGKLKAELLQLEDRKELLKERDKLSKELEKIRKELEKARKETEKARTEAGKFKKEAEKAKKETKKKIFGKSAAVSKPTVSVVSLTEMGQQEEVEELRQDNRTLRGMLQLPLARPRSCTEFSAISPSKSPAITPAISPAKSPVISPTVDSYQLGQQPSLKTTKIDEETEQEESPPLQLDVLPPSKLSVSNPEVHLVLPPASSPKTRNRPQGQQTPENTSHFHIPDPPQWTYLQSPPIPVPQRSEPHAPSSHYPLSQSCDSSL